MRLCTWVEEDSLEILPLVISQGSVSIASDAKPCWAKASQTLDYLHPQLQNKIWGALELRFTVLWFSELGGEDHINKRCSTLVY